MSFINRQSSFFKRIFFIAIVFIIAIFTLSGCYDNGDQGNQNDSTKCIDLNSDHKCDVCLDQLSTCNDTDLDHLCDLCKKALTQCIDNGTDYLCDICGDRLPYIFVSTDEGCLINGIAAVSQYTIGSSLLVTPTYSANDEKVLIEWIIYNSDGVEVTRIAANGYYFINEPGSYHITPVFN